MTQPSPSESNELPQDFAKVESVALSPTEEGMLAVIGIICSKTIPLPDFEKIVADTASLFELRQTNITYIGPGRQAETSLFNLTGYA